MTSKQDLKTALWMMVIFLITGVICYASFPVHRPEPPIRLMLQNKGGKVLFTHSKHTNDYSLDCLNCHHNDDGTYHCSQCHQETGDENMPSRAEAFHSQCKGCHEEKGSGQSECHSCHSR